MTNGFKDGELTWDEVDEMVAALGADTGISMEEVKRIALRSLIQVRADLVRVQRYPLHMEIQQLRALMKQPPSDLTLNSLQTIGWKVFHLLDDNLTEKIRAFHNGMKMLDHLIDLGPVVGHSPDLPAGMQKDLESEEAEKERCWYCRTMAFWFLETENLLHSLVDTLFAVVECERPPDHTRQQ